MGRMRIRSEIRHGADGPIAQVCPSGLAALDATTQGAHFLVAAAGQASRAGIQEERTERQEIAVAIWGDGPREAVTSPQS